MTERKDFDFDNLLAPAADGETHTLFRGEASTRNRESLGEALDRVVADLGFPPDAGVSAASLELGVVVRRERQAKGLTQAQLATRVDLSQPALSAIETGRGPDGPTWKTILRLCEALEIEPSSLATQRDRPADETVATIKLSKPSQKSGAKVYEAIMDDATARVAASLISNEARVSFSKALSGWALRKPPRPTLTCPKMWSLAPHTGMRLKADGSVVLVSPQRQAVDVRAAASRKAAEHMIFRKGAVLVSNNESVEIRNYSDETSVVFAVDADRLLDERETAA